MSFGDPNRITIKRKGHLNSYLSHASHYGELLCSDETFQHYADGHVDIILINIISEMQASMCFGHTNHGFNVTYCNGNTSSGLKCKVNQASRTCKKRISRKVFSQNRPSLFLIRPIFNNIC